MSRPKFKLYDYQEEAVTKFLDWFFQDLGMEALICLTMGLGKTITASTCVARLLELNSHIKVLWLTHREELIEQSRHELETCTGRSCEVEQAGRRYLGLGSIVVGSVATLRGTRLAALSQTFQPDLIVCDEAHHALAVTWMAVKQTFPRAKVLNLTATPYRVDVSNRLDLGVVLVEKNTTDGIRMGRLVPPKPVGKLEVNLGQVKVRLGDYETKSLSALLCREEVLDGCVALIKEHAPGQRGILFAASVEHGRQLSQRLRAAGFRVGEIYGETPTDERQRYYEGIRDGTIDLLVNNLVLTEGFDLPPLDLVIMLRPTRNAALYLQCLGRGLRKDPANPAKTHCLVIDIIDSTKHKNGKAQILPTEDDRRIYSAWQGRESSLPEVFLSWFYRAGDLTRLVQKEITLDQCDRLDSAAKLHRLLALPWESAEINRTSRECLARIWTKEGTYADLSRPYRTNGPEVLMLLLARKGWIYVPRNKVPKDEEQLVELAASTSTAAPPGNNFTIQTLISKDADLRHFLLDLFDPKQSLKEQAAKCYDSFPLDGFDVAWFKTIQNYPFHFIQWKGDDGTNHILVRTENAAIHKFEQHGFDPLQHVPGCAVGYSDLPEFVKGIAWASQSMSPKQAEHVYRILGISPAEGDGLKISRLSASALMSNHWNRGHLKTIASLLAYPENLRLKGLPECELSEKPEAEMILG